VVKTITVELSEDDLMIIHNALNEICNAIDLQEFETRIGHPKEVVRELFGRIKRLDS